MRGVLSQCMHLPNHHNVHFTFYNFISIKLKTKLRFSYVKCVGNLDLIPASIPLIHLAYNVFFLSLPLFSSAGVSSPKLHFQGRRIGFPNRGDLPSLKSTLAYVVLMAQSTMSGTYITFKILL